MNKYQYLQSYELLVALVVTYQSNLQKHLPFLEEIAKTLDEFYKVNEFSKLLVNVKEKKNENSQQDLLFVDFHDLSLQYSNLDILNLRERIIIYTCIISWLKKLDYILFDESFLKRVFDIDEDQRISINSFLSDNNKDRKIGKNELFLLKPEKDTNETLEGQWIKSNKPSELRTGGSFYFKELQHILKICYIEELKLFLITCNDCRSIVTKNELPNICGWEILQPGEKISIDNKVEIDYHDLKSLFLQEKYSQKLQMTISDLAYLYSNGKGIKKFSVDIEPGTLLGILGKEGSGKSILLKLLAGEIVNNTGEILINGYNLTKDLYHLKGMIGFVPEEDLLYDELTVFENLYLTAKLYLGKTSEKEIHLKVDNLLGELDLFDLKHSVVGSVKNKYLQPGQRRLLNIALELIRDPQILIVDNAITPLSLSDSSKIIEVLANYTFQGKIVITSITQTGKNSFAYFDKLFILDDGGFPVYHGKTTDTRNYFNRLFDVMPNYDDPLTPDFILQFINQKKQQSVKSNQIRFRSPVELYKNFSQENSSTENKDRPRKILPEKILNPPTLERQYIIFFLRNFKTEIARRKELIYTIILTPFLAMIISLFLRDSSNPEYTYSLNPNIPSYLFLSTIIAIFLGLIQSVNEIIKERKINKKQEYLNLSRFSYVNSKITYLFVISLIQSFLFISIGNVILEIRGSLWVDWLIFFSCQSFGILLGLIFSNTQRTIEGIYTKSIPIALLLQLLLGGGFLNLDTFNFKNKNYTPIVADFVVSRWAYEASMVYHFKENRYEREFYQIDRDISSGKINSLYLLPIIKSQIEFCAENFHISPDSTENMLRSIKKTITDLSNNHDIFPYENINKLSIADFNALLARDLMDYHEYVKLHFYSLHMNAIDTKEHYQNLLTDSLGIGYLENLKSRYYNYAIAKKATNDEVIDPFHFYDGIPFQVSNPVFQFPESDLGRGQMFIPEKQFSGQRIDTVEFNISIIWLINLMLYVVLVTSLLSRLGFITKTE